MTTHSLALRLGVDQLLAKVFVFGAILAGALNDNLLVVIRELVNDVFVLLVELEVVVGRYALLVDGSSAVQSRTLVSFWFSLVPALIIFIEEGEGRRGAAERTASRPVGHALFAVRHINL